MLWYSDLKGGWLLCAVPACFKQSPLDWIDILTVCMYKLVLCRYTHNHIHKIQCVYIHTAQEENSQVCNLAGLVNLMFSVDKDLAVYLRTTKLANYFHPFHIFPLYTRNQTSKHLYSRYQIIILLTFILQSVVNLSLSYEAPEAVSDGGQGVGVTVVGGAQSATPTTTPLGTEVDGTRSSASSLPDRPLNFHVSNLYIYAHSCFYK